MEKNKKLIEKIEFSRYAKVLCLIENWPYSAGVHLGKVGRSRLAAWVSLYKPASGRIQDKAPGSWYT